MKINGKKVSKHLTEDRIIAGLAPGYSLIKVN
jgi:hypothetical protein